MEKEKKKEGWDEMEKEKVAEMRLRGAPISVSRARPGCPQPSPHLTKQ